MAQEKYERIWMRGYVNLLRGRFQSAWERPIDQKRAMSHMCQMKTISLRELHNHTGKWVRSVEHEQEIIVTDRGVEVARLRKISPEPKMKIDWRHRDYVAGYLTALNAGILTSQTDSIIGISADRTSRDNSVAGMQE